MRNLRRSYVHRLRNCTILSQCGEFYESRRDKRGKNEENYRTSHAISPIRPPIGMPSFAAVSPRLRHFLSAKETTIAINYFGTKGACVSLRVSRCAISALAKGEAFLIVIRTVDRISLSLLLFFSNLFDSKVQSALIRVT